jgi:hypothetical protein
MGTRRQKVSVFRDGKGVVEEQDAEIGRGPMIDLSAPSTMPRSLSAT